MSFHFYSSRLRALSRTWLAACTLISLLNYWVSFAFPVIPKANCDISSIPYIRPKYLYLSHCNYDTVAVDFFLAAPRMRDGFSSQCHSGLGSPSQAAAETPHLRIPWMSLSAPWINPKMVWVGWDLKDYPTPLPAWAGIIISHPRLLQTPSNMEHSKDGAATDSLVQVLSSLV